MSSRRGSAHPRFYEEVQEGMRVLIRCEGCGRWFPWTAVGRPEVQTPPTYHNKSCQKRHKEALLSQLPGKCPRLDKRMYASTREAELVCGQHRRVHHELLRPYRCVCGGLHIGRLHYRIVGLSSGDR